MSLFNYLWVMSMFYLFSWESFIISGEDLRNRSTGMWSYGTRQWTVTVEPATWFKDLEIVKEKSDEDLSHGIWISLLYQSLKENLSQIDKLDVYTLIHVFFSNAVKSILIEITSEHI